MSSFAHRSAHFRFVAERLSIDVNYLWQSVSRCMTENPFLLEPYMYSYIMMYIEYFPTCVSFISIFVYI